jgi:hypothetical protein
VQEDSDVRFIEVEAMSIPQLAPTVELRLQMDLGPERAGEVIRCLRTAMALLKQREADCHGFRLAASAAYNLREALNRTVENHDPAEGGLSLVLTAWATYEAQIGMPDSDRAAARETFDSVMRTVASGKSRASGYARKLITHLQQRAGVTPLEGATDPIREFQTLLEQANNGLHGNLSDNQAVQLLERILDWFRRVFASPDEVVDQILNLAAQPWTSNQQTQQLAQLATNSHHLRLFFGAVKDPAWLTPLHSAGLVAIPAPEVGWPAAALTGGLGRTAPARVAKLLQLVLNDIKRLPKDERIAPHFELLRIAVHIGVEGWPVVIHVASKHGDNEAVQSLAVRAALDAEPSDPFVETIANLVLNYCSPFPRPARHETVEILNHLTAGTSIDNFVARGRILASKTRSQAKNDEEQVVRRWLDPEALSLDLAEHPQTLLLFAHHLSRLISSAPQYKVAFDELWGWVKNTKGEVGDRLRAKVLAGATDEHLPDTIAHVATRIARALTTAEDVLLVNSIMECGPSEEDLQLWVEACGKPSPSPARESPLPEDWRRIWRWAAILPKSVLGEWTEAIDELSADWGQPSASLLTVQQRPQIEFEVSDSPLSTASLSARTPLEVVAMLARPESSDRPDVTTRSTYGVGGALEEAVKANPVAWAACPQEVFDGLQQDELLRAYVRGLQASIEDVIPNTHDIIAVVVRRLLQTLAPIDLSQPIIGLADPSDLQRVLLDLVRALANHDGEIDTQLDELWRSCVSLIVSAPTTGEVSSAPLERAINSPWGNGLQTMLTLAGWEHRNRGNIREDFVHTLDQLIGLTTAAGLELRAILASHRPFLESVAGDWLETRLRSVFREGPFGQQTFDLTVEWSHPTPWFHAICREALYDAAKRNVNNAARSIAVGLLRAEVGYDIAAVAGQLADKPVVLARVIEDIAYFVQDADQDSPVLTRAIRAWDYLIGADEVVEKEVALAGIGRWAFVKNVDDDRWLQMTAATLAITRDRIDHQIWVADRTARIPASDDSCTILLALLNYPDNHWDRQYIAKKSIDLLRSWPRSASMSAQKLLTRLIDLGYHDARSIMLPNATPA